MPWPVPLETHSLRVPTIASAIAENTSALPEWFPTFRAGAADDLARVLRRHLAQGSQVSAELAREVARWVQARFDWDRIAEQYHWRSAADLPASPRNVAFLQAESALARKQGVYLCPERVCGA